MEKSLHILTRQMDDLTHLVVPEPEGSAHPLGIGLSPGLQGAREVFDLTSPNPDYKRLVHAIFDATRIAVW